LRLKIGRGKGREKREKRESNKLGGENFLEAEK
jgi:hypothetical protein